MNATLTEILAELFAKDQAVGQLQAALEQVTKERDELKAAAEKPPIVLASE